MIYLTVNDQPGGVYKSQVVDVIHYLNSIGNERVKLVAFISVRNFKQNKAKIRLWIPDATVLPMWPGLKNWKKSRIMLRFVRGIRSEKIIARNPMAWWLAHRLNKHTMYDGRGAIAAELKEYPDLIPDKVIVHSIALAEKEAVLNAYYRIAVSKKLVTHWQREFSYSGEKHLIIPCLVDSKPLLEEKVIDQKRVALGYSKTDIVLIYAGGISGWQSFDLLKELIETSFKNPNVKLLMLSPQSEDVKTIQSLYPERVTRQWVDPENVHALLQIADYGLLLRENTVTNQVASPVKFSEYLNAGIPVILSAEIGDFSGLAKNENLGLIYPDIQNLENCSYERKKSLNEFAANHLSKKSFEKSYQRLFQC